MASSSRMTTVQAWLDSLQLGQFSSVFLMNGLTELHHLVHLTESQLTDMGIMQPGYQRRILSHLPSEAEALLSELVSDTERGTTPQFVPEPLVVEPPPPLPPPRIKQRSKWNGQPTTVQPNIDEEKYLVHSAMRVSDSTAEVAQMLPTRAPLKESDWSLKIHSASTEKQLNVSQSLAATTDGSDVLLSKEMRPIPKPRVRSDPLTQSEPPPPLPHRREKSETSQPRQQSLGYLFGAENVFSSNNLQLPSAATPDRVFYPLAVSNDREYPDESAFQQPAHHLLFPPPVLPFNLSVQTDSAEPPVVLPAAPPLEAPFPSTMAQANRNDVLLNQEQENLTDVHLAPQPLFNPILPEEEDILSLMPPPLSKSPALPKSTAPPKSSPPPDSESDYMTTNFPPLPSPHLLSPHDQELLLPMPIGQISQTTSTQLYDDETSIKQHSNETINVELLPLRQAAQGDIEDLLSTGTPIRPPSLFCNSDVEDEPKISPPNYPPPALFPLSGSSASENYQLTRTDLSAILMTRPVPIPPLPTAERPKPENSVPNLPTCVLPSLPPRNNYHEPQSSFLDSVVEDECQGLAMPASESMNQEQIRDQTQLVEVGPVQPPLIPAKSAVPPTIPIRRGSELTDLQGKAPLPRKTSNLIDLSSSDGVHLAQFQTVSMIETSNLLDRDLVEDLTDVTDSKTIEDQYSQIQRPPKLPPRHDQELPKIPPRPTALKSCSPPIPPRLDPQEEAAPTSLPPKQLSPLGSTGMNEPYHSESNSHIDLSAPILPSAHSHSSVRQSYTLLSESTTGSSEHWKNESPILKPTQDPFGTSPFDSGVTDSIEPHQKPNRPAPPPPIVKSREGSPIKVSKLSPRPVMPKRVVPVSERHFRKEEEYDLLDPTCIPDVSEQLAFKELAQSEESGDDDDSGFDMDSLDCYGKATAPEVGISQSELNERRNKIEGMVHRMGKERLKEAPTRPVKRTHSRAIDENTRKRLSNKLSQSLQDQNAKAEAVTKVTVLKKKGYLWKQGGKINNKGYRKRWVVFDGNEMRYYENEKTISECKGIIPVGTMRDVKNLCGMPNKFGDTKQNQITLATTGRSFHFAAETCDEGTLWANVLMQAILSFKPAPGGFPVGGDMSSPDKKGYAKIDGYHQKRFLVIKGEKLCIYNTEMDFESAVAILDIQMQLASVKEQPKNKIQLATPSKIYMLTIDTPADVKEWMEAMKEAIQEGLSDHSVLEKIQSNESNKCCADCRMKNPDWASINLAITICKNCSGLHRNLGVHLSKVRSLKMDTKVWTSSLIQLMLKLGNDNSNSFWEANLNENEKAVPDDAFERRQSYIDRKYKDRKYCQSATDRNMDKALVKAASIGDLKECVKLVFSGANVGYTREDNKTACDIATSQFPVIAEFLSQNVGIQIVPRRVEAAQTEKKSVVTSRESIQESVHYTGYLYKTGANKKEFLRRYCTLEHGIFSYYDDKTQPPKKMIEGIDMVLIAITEPRQGHKFCFEMYVSNGRAYLMSAETEEERKKWMIALAKIHSLKCMWDTLEEFEQAGFLHKKEGAAATNWQRLWFILKGKSLVSFSAINDKLEEIDLRKVISLSQPGSETSGSTDYIHTLSIVLPGKNIYLRSETKQAADCWYEALQKITSQGGQSLEDQLLTRENVPIIVSECINFVTMHDGILTEGIYRLSGTSSVIRRIVTSFIENRRTARLKEEYSVHDVSGALKKFFRELPDPLLTTKLYQKWTEVAAYKDHTTRLQWYQHLLSELPPVNRDTLKMLIGHLRNIADNSDFNKMYVRNLAAVFGPTLMASQDSTFVHAEHEIAVIADLITYYAWLFGVTDEEMAKEREKELKYQEGLVKIKAAQSVENSFEQLILVAIYMGKREDGVSINIKMSMEHTAGEILDLALGQQKMVNDGSWALFEVIANGELERLLHSYEIILPQILAWNQQMAAGNYICIKPNQLIDTIRPFMDQASLSDIVKYSESKKTFKKYSFELMNNMITCSKDKSAGPANMWRVADMKIYVGIEKKRFPPTQWGISFILNNEDHGMRAICLENERSYNFWLAGMLKAKVVDPMSLSYSPHALAFRSESERSTGRYSRNLPRELSNLGNKMSFWRKSRVPMFEDS